MAQERMGARFKLTQQHREASFNTRVQKYSADFIGGVLRTTSSLLLQVTNVMHSCGTPARNMMTSLAQQLHWEV